MAASTLLATCLLLLMSAVSSMGLETEMREGIGVLRPTQLATER
jgi:hypothetical protein